MGVPPGLLFDSGGFGVRSAASQRRDELLLWAAAWSPALCIVVLCSGTAASEAEVHLSST